MGFILGESQNKYRFLFILPFGFLSMNAQNHSLKICTLIKPKEEIEKLEQGLCEVDCRECSYISGFQFYHYCIKCSMSDDCPQEPLNMRCKRDFIQLFKEFMKK